MDERERRLKENRVREFRQGLPPPIDRKSLIIKHLIGEGSFSRVYLGEYEKKKVVVKQLKADYGAGEEDNDTNNRKIPTVDKRAQLASDLVYEAIMLRKAAGGGVVQIIAYDETNWPPMILTEFMCKYSVEHEFQLADKDDKDSIFHLSNHRNITESDNGVANPVLFQMVRIARDVATALARMHSLGLIHLDIAARNILLDANKRPKIADFGLATVERDMIEQYESYGKKLEELRDQGISGSEARVIIESDMETSGSLDDNAIRKYRTQTKRRPIKWMPEWVLTENPRLDRHADVYAFGCLMFEMSQHHEPHFGVDVNDVMHRKRQGQGNPSIPAEIDVRYADIISMCWESYDRQPSMDLVVQHLNELHRTLATATFNVDVAYTELKGLVSSNLHNNNAGAPLPTPSAAAVPVGAAAEAVVSPSAAEYSSWQDTISSTPTQGNPGCLPTARPVPAEQQPPKSFLPVQEGKIRLACPPHIEIHNIERIVEFEDTGIPRKMLEAALFCASRLRDHGTIANYMECIRVENSAAQVQMIQLCLQYLMALAKDQHGTTDEEDEWKKLCYSIVRVLQGAAFPKLAQSVTLDRSLQIAILVDALAAIAALLYRKSSTHNAALTGVLPPFESEMCKVVVNALSPFVDVEKVVENAAELIASLTALSTLVMTKLYEEGVVVLLLDGIKLHSANSEVVMACVKSLGSFPIRFLVEARKFLPPGEAATKQDFVIGPGWTEVFDVLFGVTQRCLEENSVDVTQTGAVDYEPLLETSLITLFNTCESGVCEPDHLELFLYSAKQSTIELLLRVIKRYPDHFRIQEGAIGVLAHILSTGTKRYQVDFLTSKVTGIKSSTLKSVKVTSPAVIVPLALTVKERIVCLLYHDPKLVLLLSAMEKFEKDDKVAISINRGGRDLQQDNLLSAGMYGSLTSTRTASMTASRTTSSITRSHSTSSDGFDIASLERQLQEEMRRGMIEVLQIDENGEHISAASLQRSVAIILGLVCNSNRDVQRNLIRSRYNELILRSFQAFKNDVDLIQYGCHAIFSTCRGSAEHQRKLHELKIVQHLWISFKKHQNIWMVVDGIICALIGLLEPSPSYQQSLLCSDEKDAAKCKLSVKYPTNMRNSDSFRLSEILIKTTKNGLSPVQELALMVAEFQMDPNCHPIVCNFLKLTTSIIYWQPELMNTWSGVFIDLSGSERFKGSVFRQVILQLAREFGRVSALKMNATKPGNNGNGNATANASLFENHEAATISNIQSLVGDTRACSITDYIHLMLKRHFQHRHVLAAGLAWLTAIFRNTIGQSVELGSDLPYDSNKVLSRMRDDALKANVMDYCMQVMKESEPFPVLIRYSLWLLIIFISQNKTYAHSVAAVDSLEAGESLAADIAINDGIEWAIEVMKTFDTFYSLQALATIFLICMERYGHLSNRDEGRLRELQGLLDRNRNTPISDFVPLEEEGHDTYTMGSSFLTFGDLRVHSDKLYRLVESHIQENIEEEEIRVIWDSVVRPTQTTVSGVSWEEDEATRQRYAVYSVDVTFSSSLSWTVNRRFSIFLELQERLYHELSLLPVIAKIVLSKTRLSKLAAAFGVENNVFLEERCQLLKAWLAEVHKIRASRYTNALTDFVDIRNQALAGEVKQLRHLTAVDTSHFARIPNKAALTFPVESLHYDIVHRLLFVASGVPVPFLFGSTAKVRGSLAVYRLQDMESGEHYYSVTSAPTASPSLLCAQYFNCAAVAVNWEPVKRCVIVALATGPMLFYFLDESCRTLTYCGELDYNRDRICNLIIASPVLSSPSAATVAATNSLLNTAPDVYLIAASVNNILISYNLTKEKLEAQSARMEHTICALCYDALDHLALVGTPQGSVVLYNLRINPPTKVHAFDLSPSGTQAPKVKADLVVTAMVFVQETRLLYVACNHAVHILRICTLSNIKKSTVWQKLPFNPALSVSTLSLVQKGKLVVLGGCNGAVAVYDMTDYRGARRSSAGILNMNTSVDHQAGVAINQSAGVSGGFLASKLSAAADNIDHLATSAAQLMPWEQVIRESNSKMRDWLRALGVDAILVRHRAELLSLVARTAGIDVDTLTKELLPPLPRMEVLFAWNFIPYDPVTGSKKSLVQGTQQQPQLRATIYVEETQCLLFGCKDGTVRCVSLQDFYPPYAGSMIDSGVVRAWREEALLKDGMTSAAAIKGLPKTMRGKRHQLAAPK